MKLLLIRMDRMGDLVCSLPMDQHPLLQKNNVRTQWLISKGLEPVVDCANPPRKYFSFDLKFSFSNLISLIQKLKGERFDQVILFYAPWWVALACLIAGIPQRFSPRSRWFQILFFNHTFKQKRSLSEKHEAAYNWDLIHWTVTGKPSDDLNIPYLSLNSTSPIPSPLPNEYIVIHPGMGGSALNWPTHLYLELIQKLLSLDKKIVITGTASDQEWLSDLEKTVPSLPGVFWMVGKLDIKTLIAVLSKSIATIAPSTGVLHLAASTEVKTIGIYSPIRVQTPVRWGPRGKATKALVPSVNCPASTSCLKTNCKHYPCLEQITPSLIVKEIFGEIQI